MCVVTEELSRGYIGVGSLGTRTEIAGELIRLGGTEEQKAYWLPKLASGEILPDRRVHRAQHRLRPRLAHHPRRAQGRPAGQVTGAKNWITHAARADLMTLLVRTDPAEKGYQGPVDAAGREAARHRRRPLPGRRPDRRRDPRARLSRHEGVHALLRRLRGARGQPARRRARARASSSSWRPSRVRASRPRRAPSASRSTRSSWACNTPRTATSSASRCSPSRASRASSPGWRPRS